MLYRSAYDDFLSWKAKKNKKALCVVGARQIGKTTLIREFAKKNYSNFVEINFVSDKKARNIFEDGYDADTIIRNLTAHTMKKLAPHETLIFFDEVQEFPNVRTAMKFLVEDGRFDYIESGSLLGVKHKNVESYPVGFEEIYKMYPMNFFEFCVANSVPAETFSYLKRCFDEKSPVSTAVHDVMNRLFYSYIIIGGMPKVVQTYIDSHDIALVIEEQRDILELYRLDISKYAENSDKTKIRDIFDSIPAQLSAKNRRFLVNSLNENARLVRYQNSFKWLEDAGVALPCYNVTEPTPPLMLNQKSSLFKLFMNDTGLLSASAMKGLQLDLLQGRLDVNMGSVLENLVAQELKSSGFELSYFSSNKHGEVDFVLQDGGQIDLIEVKYGNDYRRHKALDNVMSTEAWKFRNIYVLCRGNVENTGKLSYMPWYMLMFMKTTEMERYRHTIDLSALT